MAVVLNDDSEHRISLADQPAVSFLAWHESTALLKYVLRYSILEDKHSFKMIQEEIYFTNISMNAS